MQVGRRALFCLVPAMLFVGCSLGWEVRPDPGNPGTPDTGGDAFVDNGTDAPEDRAVEDVTSDAPDCAALAQKVADARALARTCMLSMGHCTDSVKDECDCDVPVRSPSTNDSMNYLAAVDVWKKACSPKCTGCPQLTPRASWACLQTGSEPHCEP